MLVGYERSYRGRAAGMRTFGLVCMASAALTVFVGETRYWYGGAAMPNPADATRVVQGIVTGIGFLGAGVIIKDGINIAAKAARSGYHVVRNSLVISYAEDMLVWRFAAVALDRAKAVAPSRLAQELATAEDLSRFTISPVRN